MGLHDHDLHDNHDHQDDHSGHDHLLHNFYRNSSHNLEESSKDFLWKMSITLSSKFSFSYFVLNNITRMFIFSYKKAIFLLFLLETLSEHDHKHNDDIHNKTVSNNIELNQNGSVPVLSSKKI